MRYIVKPDKWYGVRALLTARVSRKKRRHKAYSGELARLITLTTKLIQAETRLHSHDNA